MDTSIEFRVKLNNSVLIAAGFEEADNGYYDIVIYEGSDAEAEERKTYLSVNLAENHWILGNGINWIEISPKEYLHEVQNLYKALTGKRIAVKIKWTS